MIAAATANAPRCERVFFLMVRHPAHGWMRVGNAYGSRKDAAGWRGFVRGAWRGCRVRISTLKLRYDASGNLSAATLRTLGKKFNLDAPAPAGTTKESTDA